jgi:hypothetical protein
VQIALEKRGEFEGGPVKEMEIKKVKGAENEMETSQEKGKKIEGDGEDENKMDGDGVNEEDKDKEVKETKEVKNVKGEKFMRKFKQIKINKKGILFFKLNETYEDKINLLKISDSIVQDFRDGLTSKYVRIFKIIPIEVCCFASMNNFEHYGNLFFKNYLNSVKEEATLSLFFKCRNNSKFTKSEILEWVQENKPENLKFLDYKGDYTLFVDIVQVLQ